MSDTPTQRYVPGAPPSVPASKSSKKKRKTGKGSRSEDSPALSSVAIPDSTSATLLEKTPDASDVRGGLIVDSSPADPHSTNGLPSGQSPLDEAKHSPVVDLIQKRIKTTNKKIVRGSRAWKYGTAPDAQPLYSLEYKAMQLLAMKNSMKTKEDC
jgi:hypothetical protein